ncbi:MAG: hypothetical protein A2745_02950 [Candidatus Harrisonbacteria bacterium RIFCSPHIGHO2_01_FULL_44_13]|uniref:Uncharacterized protein n=1 Tax=Candidatus Harrisonbacteria bacterium RIFCSPLOWO2_01_FULL_44_18 TaxID=1798407 RepID=A0A1G1ZM71_9BACT|nr:MAG: hypothetical protein A2745_02950 [Candidatus Harrisonbacteria bacterium RIFCSPHIGHO2_01_FULL_44_13]OGY65743.1 MAG: hypothetical protein A3A16_03975 [Candidatus Harrisonbacteria bacterium RIFCSPLOWO2_01_FULL_44_18]
MTEVALAERVSGRRYRVTHTEGFKYNGDPIKPIKVEIAGPTNWGPVTIRFAFEVRNYSGYGDSCLFDWIGLSLWEFLLQTHFGHDSDMAMLETDFRTVDELVSYLEACGFLISPV